MTAITVNDSPQALAQLNTLIETRDIGVNAEPEPSGSKTVFLSPGLSYSLIHDVRIYAFLQFPAYRNVNGTQLSADWSLIVWMTMRY